MPQDSEPDRSDAAPSIEERLEAWLRPFLDEPILWPVLAVAVGVVATNLTPLLVLSLRDRRLSAISTVVILFAFGVRGALAAFRRRRLGPVGGVAVAVAAVCAAETAVYLLLITR